MEPLSHRLSRIYWKEHITFTFSRKVKAEMTGLQLARCKNELLEWFGKENLSGYWIIKFSSKSGNGRNFRIHVLSKETVDQKKLSIRWGEIVGGKERYHKKFGIYVTDIQSLTFDDNLFRLTHIIKGADQYEEFKLNLPDYPEDYIHGFIGKELEPDIFY